jgi:hypothetical protein
MQLSIDTNYSLTGNNDYMIIKVTQEQLHSHNERQRSVNDFWICNQLNWKVICSLLFIFNRQAAFEGKRDCGTVTATFWYWASTERQQYYLWYISWLETDLLAVIHNQSMGSLYRQKRNRHDNSHILKVSVNGVSTVSDLVSKSIGMPFASWYP